MTTQISLRRSVTKGFLILPLLLVSCLLYPASSASAQAQDGALRLVTSPIPLSLAANPGSEVKAAIKIKNDGTTKETLKISVLKFKAYEETGKPELLDPEEGDEFLKWISFSEDPFTVEPQEWKTITATWKLPPEAALSYYYAILFSRADTSTEIESRQTVIVGGTAILALVEAKVPGAEREASVTDFSVEKRMYEFLPANFRVRLQNTGNVHVAPRGNIFVTKGGKDITTLEVNPYKGNILPESARIFEEKWADGFPVYVEKTENGKAVLDEAGHQVYELDWNWKDASKLRWGKYTAKLLLTYDDGQRDVPIEGEVSFWVLPWRLVLLAIAIPVIPAFLVYFFMKWRMRRAIAKKS